MEFTSTLVNLDLDENLAAFAKEAREQNVPIVKDETLNLLLTVLRMCRPERILEIGTAVGFSGTAMLLEMENAKLTTIEKDEKSYNEAKNNFQRFCVDGRVTQILGDAAEELKKLDGQFDFIFLDGPKAQYEKYLPDIKRLLVSGGVLFSDDVMLYGWVSGEVEPPPKRRAFAEKIKHFLQVLTKDKSLRTSVLNVGDGVAISVKL